MRLFEKIKLINDVFEAKELHSNTYKEACLDVLNKYEQQLPIHDVVGQSEQLVLFAGWLQYNGKWDSTEKQVEKFLEEQKQN